MRRGVISIVDRPAIRIERDAVVVVVAAVVVAVKRMFSPLASFALPDPEAHPGRRKDSEDWHADQEGDKKYFFLRIRRKGENSW